MTSFILFILGAWVLFSLILVLSLCKVSGRTNRWFEEHEDFQKRAKFFPQKAVKRTARLY